MKQTYMNFIMAFLLIATLNSQTNNATNAECSSTQSPICGADGKTYQNECKMQKAGVKKSYDGWCNNDAPVAVSTTNVFNFVKDAKNGFAPDGMPFTGCNCDLTFNPVCGENGVTYSNYCRAACRNVKPVHYGQCGAMSYDFDATATCSCDYAFSPTCGSNGMTYENACVTKCFNVNVNFSGYCTLPCSCAFNFKPVCGENGRQYINSCLMDCAQVSKFSDGMCINDVKCGKCYGQIRKVCGKDGKTYDNDCYMECAGVKKQYDGVCVQKMQNSSINPFNEAGINTASTQDMVNNPNSCACPRIYMPVCGKNNITYANECELNCAGVSKLNNNACGFTQPKDDACVLMSKTGTYQPVCGSNQITYYNKDMVACDAGISILYEGQCKPVYYEWCGSSTTMKPVCGVDGRTYLNEEVLKCVGIEKYRDNSCELGTFGWMVGPEQKGNMIDAMRATSNSSGFSDPTNNYWYNSAWGDKKNDWNCTKTKDGQITTCEPLTNVKFMRIQGNNQNGYMVFIPPIRNLNDFSLPYRNGSFPGFQGFLPSARYISYILENSYTKSNAKINDILTKVFDSNNPQIEILNFYMSLDSKFKSEYDIRLKLAEKNGVLIPEDHKAAMRNDPSLYYLFFTLLINEKIVDPETKINENYTVRDALFFILQDVWKVNADMVIQPRTDTQDNL